MEPIVVKWKYREVKPGEKNHTINGYIDYVEKQVKDRRDNTGPFASNEIPNIIGTRTHDEERIREMKASPNNDEFEQGKYLGYISERIGSHGCFSKDGANIDELVNDLKNHEGPVWIPIVSLKESYAFLYGLDTEAQWVSKARELAETYREILGIPSSNFEWVAAFHTKSEADQNHEADAGCQPHLHFMMWEKESQISKYSLDYEKVDKVRTKTANILSKEYMKQAYAERNELRDDLSEKASESLLDYAEDIRNLVLDIVALTKGEGRITVGEFETRVEMCSSIAKKLQTNIKLNPREEYYLSRLQIESAKDAARLADNYGFILEELDKLCDKCLGSDEVVAILSQWYELSMSMRSAQGENLARENTLTDLQEIKRSIKNGILDQCKDASYNNSYITPHFKGMFADKIQNGIFKPNTSVDTVLDTIDIISTLCKSSNISEETCLSLQNDLLERSNFKHLKTACEQDTKKKYETAAVYFDATTRDFWRAMRAIQIKVNKKDLNIRTTDMNSYSVAHATALKPITKTVMDLRLSTVLDEKILTVLNSSIPSYLSSPLPINADTYTKQYESVLNAFVEANQISTGVQEVTPTEVTI